MEIKYTKEQEDELIGGYTSVAEMNIDATSKQDEREDYILKYMAKHSKSKKSVIAKLSKSGVYITRPKVSKVTGTKPETKEQMLTSIALKLGMSFEDLEGLDKGPKLSLQRLLKRVSEL